MHDAQSRMHSSPSTAGSTLRKSRSEEGAVLILKEQVPSSVSVSSSLSEVMLMLMFLLLASSDEEEGVLKNEAPFLNRDCIVEAMTIMDNMCDIFSYNQSAPYSGWVYRGDGKVTVKNEKPDLINHRRQDSPNPSRRVGPFPISAAVRSDWPVGRIYGHPGGSGGTICGYCTP